MDQYIELCANPIRFDAVSQLTNVFFDDTNKQVFAVRSGGATGVVVKDLNEEVIQFCMSDRGGVIRSIKFSPDNQILAVQRKKNAVEFICFQSGQPLLQEIITHQVKADVYGFVWVHQRECALITEQGIEIYTVLPEKRQVRSAKAVCMEIRWFAWCSEAALLLCATETNGLTPVLVKQKTITKLPKLDLGSTSREVKESIITLGQVYGTMAVLILLSSNHGMEVEVYLLNGPGLAPRKCHVLRLGLMGRFAINTVDNLIVVHHQESQASLLFDIALNGEVIDNVAYHMPVTSPRSIRPFSLKVPSLSPDGQSVPCELYSTNWVLFQPNIVIDAALGCMWYLNLCIEPLCTLISDRIHLTDFLLQRTNGRDALLNVLRQLIAEQFESKDGNGMAGGVGVGVAATGGCGGTLLPVLETIFNKINKVYASWVHLELQNQTAQPSNAKALPKQPPPPKVLIEQSHMYTHVLQPIAKRPYAETVLMLYLQSLSKHRVSAQEELSQMIISELIANRSFNTLSRLVSYSLLLESKSIACYLLAHSDADVAISQIALDMLGKIKAHDIIIEVLLGQGQVIEALRLARNAIGGDAQISARKFLEAALNTNDDLLFHSIFKFFQMRNLRQRGNCDFIKSEQCGDFVEHYNKVFGLLA